jgi:hypothetical protein
MPVRPVRPVAVEMTATEAAAYWRDFMFRWDEIRHELHQAVVKESVVSMETAVFLMNGRTVALRSGVRQHQNIPLAPG